MYPHLPISIIVSYFRGRLKCCKYYNSEHQVTESDNYKLEPRYPNIFVELGGGVDDALVWRCDGANVEFGFR